MRCVRGNYRPWGRRMDTGNYLEIPTSARDRFIYRIVPVQCLLDLFEKKQNVLVKPRKWEDPFENFILRSRIELPTGELARFSIRESFYGQCWTLQSRSDAMWRIHSPKADAVRIRSTVRRVAESLSGAIGDWAHAEAFIGEVRYLRNDKLVAFARNVFRGADIPTARTFAKTLLVKRPAFAHEREIRLLFFQQDQAKSKDDLFPYSVDPHAFVDQVMIDPRMSKENANALRNRIKTETAFKGAIKRSLLYAPPPELVLPFGTPNRAVERASRRRLAAHREC